MAKSPSEQFREITGALATLTERVDNLRREIDDARVGRDRTTDQLQDLLRQVALLQQSIQQLRKEWEDWDRKRWVLIGLFVGAGLSLLANLTLIMVRN